MDFALISTLMPSLNARISRVLVSYDIGCQWEKNAQARFDTYWASAPDILKLKYWKVVVPKFHLPGHGTKCHVKFNLGYTKWAGRTDGECHRSSFTGPRFTIPQQFLPTLLTLFLTLLLTTHAYGKGENNKTCIWTQRTTRSATLVRFRTRIGIPGHLLLVPLLHDFRVDQVSTTIQFLRKIVRGNPIHIGVPLTLGADPHLPSGYIENKLRTIK